MPREAPGTRAVFPESGVMISLPASSSWRLASEHSRRFADRAGVSLLSATFRAADERPPGQVASERRLAARPLLDRVDTVGVEGEVVPNGRHRCVRIVIGPSSVDRTLPAGANAVVGAGALVGAVGGVVRWLAAASSPRPCAGSIGQAGSSPRGASTPPVYRPSFNLPASRGPGLFLRRDPAPGWGFVGAHDALRRRGARHFAGDARRRKSARSAASAS